MKRTLATLLVAILGVASLSAQTSVEAYRDEVVAYSHELLQADAAIEGADADLRYSRKARLPSLTTSGSVELDFRHDEGVRPWNWMRRADIKQPIYEGGALRADVRKAELRLDISEEQLRQLGFDLCFEAEATYWALSRAEIYRRAVADFRNIVGSLRDVVARRFAEGYTSKSDLLQVESRLSDAEYQLSAAEQQYELALHNFNVLRGVEPTQPVVLRSSILDSMAMPRRCGQEMIEHHPDYEISLSERELSRWAIRSAGARFLPSIGVTLYGYTQPRQPHMAGGGMFADGGVVLSMTTPIFHFRQRREAMRSAESSYRIAQLNVESVADRLRLEESNGWTNLLTTYSRVRAIRRNLELAEENLRISTYAYGEGSVTILDVMQAQISWLQIYTNAITAQYDYAVAISAYKTITAHYLL